MAELQARFTNQQSFYGKATVEDVSDGYLLFSYGMLIAKLSYKGNNSYLLQVTNAWDYSQTTLKHLKEFIKQNVYYNNLVNGINIFPRTERISVDMYSNCLSKGNIKDLVKGQPKLI